MIEHFLRLLESRNQTKIDSAVSQVAEASVEEVCTKLGNRCVAMSLSETRGYVRVRAAQVVRRHTRRLLASGGGKGVSEAAASRIVRQATERIVPKVLRQLTKAATPAMPLQRAA